MGNLLNSGDSNNNNDNKTQMSDLLDQNDAVTTVKHSKSGAYCKIHSFGATVVSYVDASGSERLFLSKDAKLDGSKAIRGGIPIVFPHFGPPPSKESTMAQHGFARINHWKLQSDVVDDDETGALATYTLEYSKDVKPETCGQNNPWSKTQAAVDGTDCKLTYQVRVTATELTTTLIIENTGTDAFDFQCLLHTYLLNKKKNDDALVPDNNNNKLLVQVHGLGGYAISDKVSGDSGHVQSYDEDVTIPIGQEVDCVFIHPEDHPVLRAKVMMMMMPQQQQEEVMTIGVEAAGQVDEQVAPVSCVVWNPGKDKAAAMGDFGNEEYPHMVCVEPGLLGHQPILNPNATARLSQTIRGPAAVV